MLLSRSFSLALVLSFLPLAGCGDSGGGDDAGGPPAVDCVATPPMKYSEMATMWAKCTSCHSSALTGAARQGAPDAYNYDTYEAAKAGAEIAMEEVFEDAMPFGTAPDFTPEEEDMLYRWVQCGTPN